VPSPPRTMPKVLSLFEASKHYECKKRNVNLKTLIAAYRAGTLKTAPGVFVTGINPHSRGPVSAVTEAALLEFLEARDPARPVKPTQPKPVLTARKQLSVKQLEEQRYATLVRRKAELLKEARDMGVGFRTYLRDLGYDEAEQLEILGLEIREARSTPIKIDEVSETSDDYESGPEDEEDAEQQIFRCSDTGDGDEPSIRVGVV
jgi:hypothetical protein